MKVVNLVTFLVVIVFALFVNWLSLQLFPWQYVEDRVVTDMISHALSWEKANPPATYTGGSLEPYKDEVKSIIRAHNVGQHVVAYLLAGLFSMLALRFGEKQLFVRQANVNWKLALPLWLVPMGYIVVMSYDDAGREMFLFVLCANVVIILFLGAYAFAYQALGAFNSARRNTKTSG